MSTQNQIAPPTLSRCPSCSAELFVGRMPAYRMIVCAVCGAHFRQDGRAPVRRTSRLAIISFVLGILSLVLLFVSGVPAVVLGLMALGQMNKQTDSQPIRGRRLAVAGATLGGLLSLSVFAFPLVLVTWLSGRSSESSFGEVGYTVQPNAMQLVPRGTPWKWYHPTDGVDPAITEPEFHRRFPTVGYDDSHWQVAREEGSLIGFGYGDPVAIDIGTPAIGQRYSAYFRTTFRTNVRVERLVLACIRDDGLIVYLDGKEVGRDNLPSEEGAAYRLSAVRAISGPAESRPIGIPISGPLEPGEHVLAISLHNVSTESSDLRLGDMQLLGFQQ